MDDPTTPDSFHLRPSKGAGSAPLRLARSIILDIVEAKRNVGDFLGSQRELAERYRTSWPTLAQAVRWLEDDGICAMRTGRGGGLVVTAAPSDSAARAMHLYLVGQAVDRGHLAEAGEAVDELIAARACARLSRADVDALDKLLGAGDRDPATTIAGIDSAVVAAARQPVLALFAQVLGLLEADDLERAPANLDEELALRRGLALAVIAGEPVNAAQLMAKRRRWPDLPGEAPPRAPRRSEALARTIEARIRAEALPPGTRLGLERELMERFAASRLTLRAALRLLERAGRVMTLPGRGGGIFVGDLRPDTAVDAATLYLTTIRLRASEQMEARAALEARAVQLAARRATPVQAAALRHAIERERQAVLDLQPDWGARGAEVERAILQACNNPVLSFFTHMLIELAFRQVDQTEVAIGPEEMAPRVAAAHQTIAAEVLSGRPEHAARETLLHVQALMSWFTDA